MSHGFFVASPACFLGELNWIVMLQYWRNSMKWKKVYDGVPEEGVDVHVVTDRGVRGIARYWSLTEKWLTADKSIPAGHNVDKWKYADAT